MATVNNPTLSNWSTYTLDGSGPSFTVTLYHSNDVVATVTAEVSPTLELRVTQATLHADEPALTLESVAFSLQTGNYPEILFYYIDQPTSVVRASSAPENVLSTSSVGPLVDTSIIKPSLAPPSVLSTPTVASTSPTSASSERGGEPSATPTDTSDSSIGSGAIAGIAIGGIVVLAFIIGGWYFWRRRKRRTQSSTTALTDDELAKREGDGNKIVLGPDQSPPTTGAYQTQYQEMSGNGLTQELDHPHAYKYAIGGAHELRAEDQPGELPYNGTDEHGRTIGDEMVGEDNRGDGGNGEMIPVPGANNPTSQVSPHVEAQRKREVEWLEMEETRMRQRREALLQQGGGQHT